METKIEKLEKENQALFDILITVSNTLYALHKGNGICSECKQYIKIDNRDCVGCGK